MRQAKRAQIHAYVPNRIETQFLKLDDKEAPTIADWRWQGFYPRIAWPSRGSGAAVGARYWQPDLWGPLDVAGAAFYSVNNYQHYDIQVGLLPHSGSQIPARSWKGEDLYEIGDVRPGFPRFPLYLTLRYRYLPQESFYGLGPDSSLQAKTSYLQKETRAYLRTGLQFGRHAVWILEGGYQRDQLAAGKSSRYASTDTAFDDGTAPGLTDPPNYTRFGTQVFLEFRDEPGNPHKGWMLAALSERFLDQSTGRFGFQRYGADVRGYLPLGSPQRVLALRAAFSSDHPDPGNRVPFFMQESLGGSHTLRGFDSFRFRGEKLALYQAEYRWEPAAFWELAVFTDAGRVGRAGSSMGPLEWDYGFGMRFKSYRDVVLRLEVAFSRETTRYFLRSSASF
jgi:Omp85 superfamily domain